MSRMLGITAAVVLLAGCGSAATPDLTASPTMAPAVETTTPAEASPTPTATTAATPAPSAARLPAFAPDEPLVAFNQLTGAGGGLFVARPDGTGTEQLATDILPGVHKGVDWSPDGQRLVFIDEASERMWIAHLDGSATEPVAACYKPGCDHAAWSPDGTRIAFSRYQNADGIVGPAAVGIYVVDLATGRVSPVVKLERPYLADVPRWSPDGSQIVFSVDRMDADAYDTGAAIAIVPVAGGEPRYLTEFEMFASAPDWSWATNEIAFSRDLIETKRAPEPGDDTRDLYGIRPDGSGLRTITKARTGQALKGPRWTPNGTAITAYDTMLPGGVLVDPATGSFEPFVTTLPFTRPVVRPMPGTR